MAVAPFPSPSLVNQPDHVAEVRDVFKIYKEQGVETVALRGVSLHVRRGEFIAVIGPSGSGKSTLLNLMGGIDTPSAGQIWIDGHELSSLAESQRALLRRSKIGFVFQNNNLLPFLTALENVMLPMQLAGVPVSHIRAGELLQQVGLAERVQHRLGTLSGGEQQRVGIACALSNQPALLLADEPTGELDSLTAQNILKWLVALNQTQGTTIILVTHDSEAAAHASRTISMRDGQIIAGEAQHG